MTNLTIWYIVHYWLTQGIAFKVFYFLKNTSKQTKIEPAGRYIQCPSIAPIKTSNNYEICSNKCNLFYAWLYKAFTTIQWWLCTPFQRICYVAALVQINKAILNTYTYNKKHVVLHSTGHEKLYSLDFDLLYSSIQTKQYFHIHSVFGCTCVKDASNTRTEKNAQILKIFGNTTHLYKQDWNLF